MKISILIASLAILFSGCGSISKLDAQVTGYDEVCVEGVPYLQFPSGVSVKINQDGSIASCK